MGLKERLIQFLEHKNLSQGEFEKTVTLSNGFVNNIGDSIRFKSLNKITAKFPEINTTWLLTGEGVMLLNDSSRDFEKEYYAVLEDLRKKDNQLSEIKESLGKLFSAVDQLSGLHKEAISAGAAYSPSGKKAAQRVRQDLPADTQKGKSSKKSRSRNP